MKGTGAGGALGGDGLPSDLEHRFDVFVSEHQDRAVGMAMRLLGGDRAAAEDVAQEAFLRAHRGLAKFREESSLATWFYRILVREAGRHRRWRAVRRRWAADAPDEPADPRPAATPDPVLRVRIARALDRLSSGQREAFVLVHLEGFTISEAAAMLDRAPGTLKTHIHRALRTLRSELADVRWTHDGDRHATD
jgi:RNA polymerase sigma-70 factor (ECF subfamily)